ncbi:MAG TPA: tetratricopeptide repeat protein [Terriglobales bacterium]|nr:tetratricopeptide repeat protein [Terriglobales bacterium]
MTGSYIQTAVESGDPRLAKEALKEIDLLLPQTQDPNERVYLLFSKSSCYGLLGDFDQAREQLNLGLQEQPEDIDTKLSFEFHQGLLYQHEDEYLKALEVFETLLLHYGQSLTRSELRFMYEAIQRRRAFLSVTLERFKDAIPLLKEILSFDLENEIRSEALAKLGLCHLELKDWSVARDYLLQARAAGVTKDAEKTLHFYLGIAYFYTHSPQEAKEQFQICESRATEYELPLLNVYQWLASTCKLLGEVAESERYDRLARLQ